MSGEGQGCLLGWVRIIWAIPESSVGNLHTHTILSYIYIFFNESQTFPNPSLPHQCRDLTGQWLPQYHQPASNKTFPIPLRAMARCYLQRGPTDQDWSTHGDLENKEQSKLRTHLDAVKRGNDHKRLLKRQNLWLGTSWEVKGSSGRERCSIQWPHTTCLEIFKNKTLFHGRELRLQKLHANSLRQTSFETEQPKRFEKSWAQGVLGLPITVSMCESATRGRQKRERFWLRWAEVSWQKPEKQHKTHMSEALLYSATAAPFTKVNFENKALNLQNLRL
jgi:hypothetical protein